MGKPLKDFFCYDGFKQFPFESIMGIILFIIALYLLFSVSWKVGVGIMLFQWSCGLDRHIKENTIWSKGKGISHYAKYTNTSREE